MFDPLENRVPCPVCLAGKMLRTPVGPRNKLVIDHCARCGGVWFDAGEVAALREAGPEALLSRIAPRPGVHRSRCLHCDAMVPRDEDACPACGAAARLDCPRCDAPMRVARAGELRLDTCDRCRGVWFDHHEIREVWRLGALQVAGRRAVGTRGTGGEGVGTRTLALGAEGALYAPDLAFLGLDAAAHAAAAGASAAASGIGPALEAAGEVAQAAFELVVEAISSIF
jgi:Zn-finger nucleic acid-binding protein